MYSKFISQTTNNICDALDQLKEAIKKKELEEEQQARSIARQEQIREQYMERRKDPWKKKPGGRRHYDP